MKKKLLPVLLMALASGTLAAYLAVRKLNEAVPPPVSPTGIRQARVAVAARDLPVGAILGLNDVKLVNWPADALPAEYATSPDALVGRGVLMPLHANEPLLSGKLAQREGGGGLPIMIPEGMRAVSVRVDEVIGVAGFVVPGTRVDVLVTLTPRGSQGDPTTRVALQNVQVLAAGQSIQPDSTVKPQQAAVITLLVTPEQAESVTLAATEGRIQLALRNTLDAGIHTTPGASVSAMAGAPRPTAEPAVARSAPRERPVRPVSRGPAVEVFRGSARTVTTF